MSVRSDITSAMGWCLYENRVPTITVTDGNGDPVNVSAADLVWRIYRDAGSPTIYLEKTGADLVVTGVGNNEVNPILDVDTDYVALREGIWWHELWNRTTHLRLSYGDAWLLPATNPAPVA